ncbi:MAG: hypothetical protein ACT4OT_16170 [Acidobacteriota bacterium]
MDALISFLFFLFLLLVLVTLVGHGIWVGLGWFFREIGAPKPQPDLTSLSISPSSPVSRSCHNCGYGLMVQMKFCGVCGAQRLSPNQQESIRELEITSRQLDRLRQIGAMDEVSWRILKAKIDNERELMIFPYGRPGTARQRSLFAPAGKPQAVPPKTAARTVDEKAFFASPAHEGEQASQPAAPDSGAWTKNSDEAKPVAPILKPPRKPFAEVLAAFMEKRNVRWGEIIGGILIIGCSTALVISLWGQISRVPLIKFLIFTTVTAALFGIGFYTEHHWKLPTTSRGILTIATLLVPLNFLAIAAVSSGAASAGTLLIVTELFAPALFLCFVYLAGRVITPRWPHLLAAGALGSSIGQLLVRHLGAPDNSPVLMIGLGAFPVLCYVLATSWSLKIALADSEIDESEANAIFITLGALTFAASLPVGLLLHKTGSPAMAIVHLAPLVTLAAGPMLATGLLLWRRVERKRLAATRTAGGSIAILGGLTALAGMVLAWPNPASIVPAALFNFLLFTAVAVYLAEPRAHVIGALCVTLAYLVAFHVLVGHVAWQNPRVISLLPIIGRASTGQAMAIPFVSFVLVYEWFRRAQKQRDAFSYLLAAGAVAVASLVFLFIFGVRLDGDPHYVSAISALYAAGAFWLAWRERSVALLWTGVALLFLTCAQVCHSLVSVRFPWQASFLLFASTCTAGALLARQFQGKDLENLLIGPLRRAAIAATVAGAILLLVQIGWRGFEPASLFAVRSFILAAVLLGLLVLSHARSFFTQFQMAVTLGAILTTKSALQIFDWYAYRPNVWLHPWALQVQGIVLGLICLGWVGSRLLVRKRAARLEKAGNSWFAQIFLERSLAFDHLLAAALVIGFVVLMVFGTASGINRELTAATRTALVFDLGGFPYRLIFGTGSLALLATLLVLMLANLRQRAHFGFALGALIILWAFCPYLAGSFDSQFATASAARWSVAIFLLVISVAHAFGGKFTLLKSSHNFATVRFVVLFLTLGPLLVLTSSSVISFINYITTHGPQGGVFRAMGGIALYGVPLVFAAVALGIHAVRERSAVFAFSAGLLVNLTVTTTLVVAVAEVDGAMNRVVLVNALQLNAIAAACVALVWLASRPWWASGIDLPSRNEHVLLTCQKWIAIGFLTLFIVPIALHLIVVPYQVKAAMFAAGSINGWLALLLTVPVVVAFNKVFRKPLSVAWLAGSLLAAGSLAAFGGARFGVSRWAGLHVLLGALVLIAWMLLLGKDLPELFNNVERKVARLWTRLDLSLADDWPWDSLLFSSIVGALAVLVALRGPFSDPLGAWWSIASLLAVCVLAAALHWNSFKRAYLYAAGILFNLSVSIWLIKYHSHEIRNLSAFVEANIIALCLAGLLWLWLELRARRAQAEAKSGAAASFHNVAAIGSLLAFSSVIIVRLQDDFSGFYQTLFPTLDWFALGSLAVLMVACLWDREAKYAVAGIYLVGLLASATALHNLNLPPRRLAWGLMMAAAIQALLAALIWRARSRVVAWLSGLKVPQRLDPKDTELLWLSIFNSLVVATIVCLALWINLSFLEWPLRTAASIAVVAQALTFGLMAQGTHRAKWQRAAISLFLAGAVFLGWSFLTPHVNGTWLNRAVILMALMSGIVALFGIELDKLIEREPGWSKAFRDCVPAMVVAGILALVFVLSAEVYYQIQFGAVRVSYLALITVAVTLIAGVAVCIFFAVSPKHDPLSLSERRRTIYVYVAEVMMVLLFMHIRLTMSWLFRGFFERYWPLVVLLIAYAGVAVSELLKRRQIHVLAQPIERTGAFLPLLPVMGFWIVQSQIEYSTVLFVVGGLYGLLSILRRSFWFGMAAALAGNGGLWHMLNETSEFRLYQHPQLWLIPAAISVLIAAHLNRKNFSDAQMSGIRYLCLITIYVSSTADIFINGIAQSPWLPLVLAGLSIAGVFGGIMFRIRAFLLLGSIFLLLSIATMINYASVNFHWTWLWYVAGIVTGAMIIATFAVFEKKRAEVLRVVDELKDWKR